MFAFVTRESQYEPPEPSFRLAIGAAQLIGTTSHLFKQLAPSRAVPWEAASARLLVNWKNHGVSI